MNYQSATLETSCGLAEQLPESSFPEVCFSGRSNVGKSSLINRLLGRKAFARVSSTPGKTVTVNFYRVEDIRLVDLPGYGYAKITDSERQRFSDMIEHYFTSGRNIKYCFALMDMRHLPMAQDKEMLEFLKYYKIPYVIVLTKCDKLNKAETEKMLSDIKNDLGDLACGADIIPFSATKNIGVDALRQKIEE